MSHQPLTSAAIQSGWGLHNFANHSTDVGGSYAITGYTSLFIYQLVVACSVVNAPRLHISQVSINFSQSPPDEIAIHYCITCTLIHPHPTAEIITDWVTTERAPHCKRRIHVSSLVTGAHADDLLERESRSKRSLGDLSNATICAVIAPRITVAAQSRN
ncbi:hypothetical protein BLNAU_12806 [Blattamonas nauphoetae]|uniref:Uncharacterized protein n=1 Tax=Blattamonas nauphoetae TaxID=2049346 RepID=A0ABQ9XLJ5_9EUKA|nr:hypothetical protein BLNAU_12806 [Blattamonas nauphoetae]